MSPADRAGSLRVLADSGAAGELLRRDGRMARLCTSTGTVRMDWVTAAAEAMRAAGRDCWLVAIPRLSGAADVISRLSGAVTARLAAGGAS
jgi:hypothetical protein